MNVGGDPHVRWMLGQVSRVFRVRLRDLGFGAEIPRRSIMHAAYRAKTRRRNR